MTGRCQRPSRTTAETMMNVVCFVFRDKPRVCLMANNKTSKREYFLKNIRGDGINYGRPAASYCRESMHPHTCVNIKL